MTDIRYWDDAYLTRIMTVVAAAAPEEVSLEQTIFYAFAGGQERDHGTIADREVLDARWDGADIVYRLAIGHGLSAGEVVAVRIDGARRERLRRLHMATEIVLQVIFQDDPFLAKIGAHIAPEKARIDFSSTTPLSERLPRIAETANRMIDTDVEIVTAFSDAAKRRRYWEIPGWARVPCAGTLPRRTGEIGPVELRRKNPGRGKERVEITLAADI